MNCRSTITPMIIQLTLNIFDKTTLLTVSSKVTFVDLPPKEKSSNGNPTDLVMKTICENNKTLSTLDHIISGLADKQKGHKNPILPYRNSLLTKLFRKNFDDLSKIIFIIPLSPSSAQYSESLSTLKFAEKLYKLKTKTFLTSKYKNTEFNKNQFEECKSNVSLLNIEKFSSQSSFGAIESDQEGNSIIEGL